MSHLTGPRRCEKFYNIAQEIASQVLESIIAQEESQNKYATRLLPTNRHRFSLLYSEYVKFKNTLSMDKEGNIIRYKHYILVYSHKMSEMSDIVAKEQARITLEQLKHVTENIISDKIDIDTGIEKYIDLKYNDLNLTIDKLITLSETDTLEKKCRYYNAFFETMKELNIIT